MHSVWSWIGFNVFVLAMLALDLGVFHRKAHSVSVREALGWSAFWIALALTFNAGVWHFLGRGPGLEFLTGYLIEKALSVDNLFVFVLVFSYFRVPSRYQHRVLFWGILGALLMRGAMIAAGAALIQRFEWILYVFGAFLVVTGIRMAFHDEGDIDPEHNPVMRLVKRAIPVTHEYDGQRLFTKDRVTGRHVATPLFIVLAFVETTDVVFALDSIPAIFAITKDPFIVYTSNVFAILGLRSLYFLLAGVIHKFHFLKLGLAVVLCFVGVKMLIEKWVHIHVGVSLGVVGAVLALAVIASLVWPREADEHDPAPHAARAPEDETAER